MDFKPNGFRDPVDPAQWSQSYWITCRLWLIFTYFTGFFWMYAMTLVAEVISWTESTAKSPTIDLGVTWTESSRIRCNFYLVAREPLEPVIRGWIHMRHDLNQIIAKDAAWDHTSSVRIFQGKFNWAFSVSRSGLLDLIELYSHSFRSVRSPRWESKLSVVKIGWLFWQVDIFDPDCRVTDGFFLQNDKTFHNSSA